jgi:hypothetical protein
MTKTHHFEDILRRGQMRGHYPGMGTMAKNWFRNAARKVEIGDPKAFIKNDRDMRHFKRNVVIPGHMYLFHYKPKYAHQLKHYDTYPLVFPWRKLHNGFIGINLHYLPPRYRAKLMDKLYIIANKPYLNDNTKLELSYDILRKVAGDKLFGPCIHRYLDDKAFLRSKLYKIPAEYRDMALALPIARFEKETEQQVWDRAKEKLSEECVAPFALQAISMPILPVEYAILPQMQR